MGVEIEGKFILIGTSWKQLARAILYRQGYLKAATRVVNMA